MLLTWLWLALRPSGVAWAVRPRDTLDLALVGHRVVTRVLEHACAADGSCGGSHVLIGGAAILAYAPHAWNWPRTPDVDFKFWFGAPGAVPDYGFAVNETAAQFSQSLALHRVGARLRRRGWKAPGAPLAGVFSVQAERHCFKLVTSKGDETVTVFEARAKKKPGMQSMAVTLGGASVPIQHPLSIFFSYFQILPRKCLASPALQAKSAKRLRRLYALARTEDASWYSTYDPALDRDTNFEFAAFMVDKLRRRRGGLAEELHKLRAFCTQADL